MRSLILLLVFASSAHGATFRGKLGPVLEIVLTFEEKEGAVTGKYFYFKNGTDIALSGRREKNGGFVLKESGDTGTWRFTEKKGRLAGDWTPPKGKKKHALDLRRVPDEGPEDAYEGLRRLAGPVAMPYLRDYADKKIMSAVNRELADFAKEHVCTEPEGYTTVDAKQTYFAHDFYTVEITVDSCCGGCAHPAVEPFSRTYDLKTGRPLELSALRPGYAEGIAFEPDENGDSNGGVNLIYVTEAGVAFGRRVAHVIGDYQTAVIPFEKLKSHLGKDSPLARVVK